jgi:hypothetical protein
MSIILISVPVSAPVYVNVNQSDTVDGARTLANQFTYGALTTDPATGKLILEHANIDQSKHRWVSFVSALDEEGPAGYLAPVPAAPTYATLNVNLALWDASGRQPVENAKISVVPYSLPFKADTWVGTKGPWKAQTDAQGLATIQIPLGVKVKVTLQKAGISNAVIDNTVAVMNLVDYI